MKWSIVGLIIAGLVAAVSAALLVVSLRASSRAKTASAAPEVEIAMAAKPLAMHSIVKNTDVISKTIPSNQAPKDALLPAEVIGKVLAMDMLKEQLFTAQSLLTGGLPGLRLAAALGPGERAVSVSLPASSGLKGLLYPGSMVDVLASLRTPTEESGKAEVISVTLLQGIQVLGVEDRTVVSEENDSGSQRSARGQLMVTLTLDSKQAELLQLARQYGTISLALRNPKDMAPVGMAPTMLKELSRSLASRLQRLSAVQAETTEQHAGAEVARLPAVAPISQWETIVIRGGTVERYVFPVPKDELLEQKGEGR